MKEKTQTVLGIHKDHQDDQPLMPYLHIVSSDAFASTLAVLKQHAAAVADEAVKPRAKLKAKPPVVLPDSTQE